MKKIYTILALGFFIGSVSATHLVPRLMSGSEEIQLLSIDRLPTLLAEEKEAVSVLGAPCYNISNASEDNSHWETIFDEDFSLFTEGTDDEPDDVDLTESGTDYIPSDFTVLPGWWGVGVYQAGGVCALQYPGRGGVISSPRMNMFGKVKLTFSAKSVEGPAMLIVSFAKGTESNPVKVSDPYIFNLESEDGWQEYEWIFENFDNDDCFLQFNAMTFNYGVHIDNIKLERDTDYIERPHIMSATSFKTDGFISQWGATSEAESYLLDLYADVPTGEPAKEYVFDFNECSDNEVNYGEGVTATLNSMPTSTQGAEGTAAVLITSDDDSVIFPGNGGMIVSGSFFMKKADGMDEWSPAALSLSGMTPEGMWIQLGYFYAAYCEDAGDTVTLDPSLLGKYTQLKFGGIYMENPGDGVVLDNVVYTTDAPTERKLIQSKVEAVADSYEWKGLEPMMEHYFSVRSVTPRGESEPSELYHAFGVAAPLTLTTTDIDTNEHSFTASWESVPKATSYECSFYRVHQAQTNYDAYPVLEDDFAGVNVGASMDEPLYFSNIDYMPLDEYTVLPGWYGSGIIVADGMIGCQKASGFDLDILTPYLTLSNNDGVYEVEVTAWCPAGETFVVQGLYDYKAFLFEETGFATLRFTLNDGGEQQRLMIYSANNARFWIDDFKVTQKLAAGDRVVYTLEDIATTATSQSFKSPSEEDMHFAYTVTSVYTRYDRTCKSAPSEFKYVDFTPSEVEVIEAGNCRIMEVKGGVIIMTAETTEVTIYSIDGKIIFTGVVTPGETLIPLQSGLHIVRCNGTANKVFVK